MQILNSLIPIFAVIGLGMFLRRQARLSAEATHGFNSFAYYFALPLYLFYKIGNASIGPAEINKYMLALMSASIATLAIGWLLATAMQIKFASRGALVQACFRGNLAFIGLPLILFTIYELPAAERSALESAILLSFAPVVIFYNVVSVALLAIYNDSNASAFSWRSVTKSVLTNPLLIGCAGGLLMQGLSYPIPTAITRTCEVVGAAAFPMALIGIGSQMATISISGQWFEPLLASVVKCVLCPLIGGLVGWLLGLSGFELRAVLILCAVPTAVSGYVLADQMNADRDLAASAVVIGTAFSMFTLPIVLAIPV